MNRLKMSWVQLGGQLVCRWVDESDTPETLPDTAEARVGPIPKAACVGLSVHNGEPREAIPLSFQSPRSGRTATDGVRSWLLTLCWGGYSVWSPPS